MCVIGKKKTVHKLEGVFETYRREKCSPLYEEMIFLNCELMNSQ